MSDNQNRISHRFSTQVASNDDELLTTVVEEDATVEKVTVRFYPGPRGDLHVRPLIKEIVSESRSRTHDLVKLHGQDYIAGDNDTWVFYVSESIEEDDEIHIDIENVDQNGHDYTAVVDVELDRAGGSSRPFSGLFDALGGLF
jgi:hypothetical protein